MHYRFFTPESPSVVSRSRLPHVEQPNACYFITFRTADSLPRAVTTALAAQRSAWLQQLGGAGQNKDEQVCFARLSRADRIEFAKRCAGAWQDSLDSCHGACLLRTPSLRQHVVDSLRHGDGLQYDLDAFVVMPNHVHMLVGFSMPGSMLRQCRSWKHYSATRIQRALGLRGRFWQTESYDRVVRGFRSLEAYRQYIAANPRKSGLQDTEYTVYERPTPIVAET
jgi:REP element-mobilizing transposase RayT